MKSRTLTVRVPIELGEKLDAAAAKMDLSANDIAKHAIRAAVEEIERNNYQIPWPPAFELKQGDPLEKKFTEPELRKILKQMSEPPHSKINQFNEELEKSRGGGVVPSVQEPTKPVHYRGKKRD